MHIRFLGNKNEKEVTAFTEIYFNVKCTLKVDCICLGKLHPSIGEYLQVVGFKDIWL